MTRLTRLVPASLLVLAVGLALPAAALAQYGGRGDVYSRRGSFYGDRTAYDNGYREGLKRGEKDWRAGRRFDYDDDKAFRKADKGYHKEHGSRFEYERVFREGYVAGYRDAYGARTARNDRYGNRRAIPRDSSNPDWRDPGSYPNRYPSDPNYPNRYPGRSGGEYPRGDIYGVARDNGFNDGYRHGLDDGRDRDRYDPVGERDYRGADRGYNNRYGSREAYRNEYRLGFRDGYDQGYREGQRGRY